MAVTTVRRVGEHAVSAELLHDPDAYAKLLRRVHEAVLSGAPAPQPPRSVISASWDRSLAADVDPDGKLPPLVYDADELDDVRQAHPLASVLPLLRQNLVSIADDAEHIMIVTDADGHILWREGASGVCHDADRVLLTEGVRWSEDVIGTNAMGTVLATGEPVQVYSAEHLVRMYHTWTCAAAPVRHPETGALLGAIDVSGPLRTVHPAMLALVSASASLAEGQLKAQLAVRDERVRRSHMPHLHALRGEPGALLSTSGRVLATESCGPLPDAVPVTGSNVALPDGRVGTLEPLPEGYLLRLGRTSRAVSRPRLGLTFLSDSAPVVTVDGREIPITLRHAEILTVLAMHPHGMSADRLALELYGDDGNPVTVRAEIHRLRSQLGAEVVRTRPYRLAADIDADFLRVSAALRDGDVDAVLSAFDGPLLADSEAPAVRDERESLIALVRRAVLDSGDARALWRFWETSCGADDVEVVERLCRALPMGDPRRRIAAAHHARLAAAP
ncbi:MAG: GAF domain-containing protein [Actinophytocola sp.]|nr:GAF domain-containing protein [Actinophytocola sp.]